jgi:hypothetical protein
VGSCAFRLRGRKPCGRPGQYPKGLELQAVCVMRRSAVDSKPSPPLPDPDGPGHDRRPAEMKMPGGASGEVVDVITYTDKMQ